MTTADIKAMLNESREAVRAYRLARDKANAYGQLLSSGKTVKYNNDGAVHERDGNPVERAYAVLADYEIDKDEALRKMVELRGRTEKMIAKVPDPVQREVLTRRYIIGQKWEDIAECMGYSRQHITRLHGYALKKMCLNVTFSS